jgi:hypothetical protein
MPRDVAHAWKNTGAETGRVLFMYTPGSAGKLFEEMVEQPVDPMNQQEFGAAAERHGWDGRPAAVLSGRNRRTGEGGCNQSRFLVSTCVLD